MNNYTIKQLDCDIVTDLLELYHDRAVKPSTEKAINEHLEECDSCREEYAKIKEDFSVRGETTSTKKAFLKTMKASKIRQWIIGVICSLTVVCALQYTLTVPRLLPLDDVQVIKVYRIPTEEGDRYFLMYSTAIASGTTPVLKKHEATEGRLTYEFIRKVPVIHNKFEDSRYVETDFFDAGNSDELIFGGEVIWTREDNADDEIPGYVYAYNDFRNGNRDEFGSSDEISYGVNIDTDNLENPDNYISVGYPDRFVKWSLDGEIIEEREKSAAEIREDGLDK